jgi:hypothetical protein
VISKTDVTINKFNVNNFFSFNVQEDESNGTIYYFNVEVARYGGVYIKSYTTFTVSVEIEIHYRKPKYSITFSKSVYDNVTFSYDAGASNLRDSGRATIDISSAAIPDDATDIEIDVSYYLIMVSGEITY